MCDCVKKIEDVQNSHFAELYKKEKGLTIKKIDFLDETIVWRKLENDKHAPCTRTFSNIDIEVEERKRPIKPIMMHSFCPFCGIEYK